ncbi:ABC-2 type transport system ATP-binding protein [Haladaptatus litoreus]|uniref:ABC-2 type transport system ATP-binding protein n=1 Tax=Haladaptatus litoreus TaxID=553468 RepID=A0A1N6VRW7_9EURY|nr:ABC transporter ATP-binding protein [Haladaptatus litoreus]SIQ80621.1 ABC-2 type transport system ATP-binding protein [Haladaptatus litoreus]
MAAIQTNGLTKQFGEVVAVSNLDLTVEEGEIFGFLGPNGSGKSTTINMLMDYIRPTTGSANVLGYDAQEDTQTIHEQIGILPDAFDLYGRLSGRKHIQFAIDSKKTGEDADDILERVGLSQEDADRPAGDYSKGMRQRVTLGMALVGDPDLLILDEPSSGLDPHGVREMREIIRAEADRGTAVFFSSHILDQVEAICDRVAIMNQGELVTVDTIEGLRETSDTGSTMELSVNIIPDVDLTTIAGVTDATVDGSKITVTYTEPSAKAKVINAVEEAGATVTDIATKESSLEDLFTAYTTDSDDRGVESEVEA